MSSETAMGLEHAALDFSKLRQVGRAPEDIRAVLDKVVRVLDVKCGVFPTGGSVLTVCLTAPDKKTVWTEGYVCINPFNQETMIPPKVAEVVVEE